MIQSFKEDYMRMTGTSWGGVKARIRLLTNYELRYLLFLRRRQLVRNGVLKKIYILKAIRWNKKYGLDIQTNNIGTGLYLGHAHNINVNPKAIIGSNCNLAKGITIGRENRGTREGTPTIGNYVWIGTNAVVVGKIKIGNDVLIAPNSYVNCDVPDHSIVIGNPCRIVPKENATKNYINHIIE